MTSLAKATTWQAVGQAVYIVGQGAILAILAHLGDEGAVGHYALAFAIAAPIFLFANLSLRQLLATDAGRQFPISHYFMLRAGAILIALLSTLIIGIVVYEPATDIRNVIFWVASYKSAEAAADIIYGLFERAGAARSVGLSMLVRGSLAPPAVLIGFALQGVVGAAAMLFALTVLWILIHDVRAAFLFLRRENGQTRNSTEPTLSDSTRWKGTPFQRGRLSMYGFPLGIAATCYSLNVNIPRYFIQSYFGPAELGVYAVVAYFVTAFAAIIDAAVRAVAPRLATLLANRDVAAFQLLLRRSALALVLLTAALTVSLALGGARLLLNLLFGPEYAQHSEVFVALSAVTVGVVASAIAGAGLIASRAIKIKTIMALVSVATGAVAAAILIPSLGLMGAAYAYGLSVAVRVCGEWLGLSVRLRYFAQ